MASEAVIKAGIERLVGTYSLWAIGLTDSPEVREMEVGNPMGWRQFDADNEQVARNVEAHFVGKGMEGDSVGRVTRAKYVYIFMGLQSRLEGGRSIQRENPAEFGRGEGAG